MENTEVKDTPLNLFKGIKEAFHYWKWFLISVVVCVTLSVLYVWITQPVYQVDANVLIKTESEKGGASAAMSSMLQGFSFGSSLGVGGASVDDELLLINSYTLLRQSVAELGLNTRYTSGGLFSKVDYFGDSPFTVTSKDSLAETFTSQITFKLKVESNGSVKVKAKKGWSTIGEVTSATFPTVLKTDGYGDFLIEKTSYFEKNPVKSMKIVFSGYDVATESLMKDLLVSIKEKKANGINLSIEETNVRRGKALLNTIIRKYNEEGLKDKNISAERSSVFYDQRIAINERELDQIERRLEAYKIDNNLTDLETEAEILLTKNGDFKEKLIDSEIQFATVSLIEDFLKDPANKYALAPFNLGVTEKTASEGLQQYNDYLLARIRLLNTTTEDNPNVQLLNEQIEIMRNNVLETFKSIKAGFNFARQDLVKQEREFLTRIKKMPTQEREFLDIKRQQMIKSELYLYLLQQKEESALKLATTMDKAKIIDEAYSLSEPVKPNKLFIFSIALILSLAIPIIILTGKSLMKDL
ncbi:MULTISPECIES: GumC family protein [Parabacteroides]|uniref:Tyrosine-protein kinase G-rich domain-containing protein n=3 Tax=Parabacteroides goldsteinii TaxID=328812 RepID=A0A6G1ZIJ0_9BACT|nr:MULTISPECIES: GNVR domain-containing protein [Parabacteroides]EOS19329.1 hypothetical protein C803_00008 [Parabacteroides goldsteinii dnLKV18]KAI4360325.1 hypothetical protein C825_002382 [Parabacteroides sp. ASF519]MBF0767098.1 hypothetical protein [Parabacteroides goldsteinii]MRX93935.1 hypothetical protein [Parabacteroides goldsteinii]MRX99235.1 hypothetical protein [Parabacteroides goldsteinii]